MAGGFAGMFGLFRKKAEPASPALEPREIEQLMAGPVKDWPSVIVVGDEAVVGFTPAPGRKAVPEEL